MNTENIVEAILFMSPEPVSIEKIARRIKKKNSFVLDIISMLRKRYEGTSIEIVNINGMYQMRVRREYEIYARDFAPYSDLKPGHKKCLAIVAFKEPITQTDIVKILGNKAYNYLKFLEKKELIRAYKKGRTRIYKLTKKFETYFGLSKEDVKKMIIEKIKKQ